MRINYDNGPKDFDVDYNIFESIISIFGSWLHGLYIEHCFSLLENKNDRSYRTITVLFRIINFKLNKWLYMHSPYRALLHMIILYFYYSLYVIDIKR